MAWTLTVRVGSRVERSRYETLSAALDAVEAEARVAAQTVPKRTVDARFKRFEPVQQVAARVEVAGPERLLPRVRAGIDVRGDGSAEAYVGRVRRQVGEQRRGETPYRALRRALENEG